MQTHGNIDDRCPNTAPATSIAVGFVGRHGRSGRTLHAPAGQLCCGVEPGPAHSAGREDGEAVVLGT